jgi:hypothetical protein
MVQDTVAKTVTVALQRVFRDNDPFKLGEQLHFLLKFSRENLEAAVNQRIQDEATKLAGEALDGLVADKAITIENYRGLLDDVANIERSVLKAGIRSMGNDTHRFYERIFMDTLKNLYNARGGDQFASFVKELNEVMNLATMYSVDISVHQP